MSEETSKRIVERLDNIKEILKMLLINSVLNGNEMEQIQERTKQTALELLSPIG